MSNEEIIKESIKRGYKPFYVVVTEENKAVLSKWRGCSVYLKMFVGLTNDLMRGHDSSLGGEKYFANNKITFEQFLELYPEYTLLSPKFISGNWYKDLDSRLYIKFDRLKNSELLYSSERISETNYKKISNDSWSIQSRNWQKLEDLTEIQKWLPDGHVDKINKFLVNRWYKANNCWYFKYKSDDEIYVKFNELISKEGKYSESRMLNNTSKKDNHNNFVLLTDLSEIQQFLPDGHPDKEKKSLVGRYLKVLNGFKLEKYLTIERENNNSIHIFTKEYPNEAQALQWQITNGYVKLMPEGFTPENMVPEYVECIKDYGGAKIGQIFDTKDDTFAKKLFKLSWKDVLIQYNHLDKSFITSTKEAYESQQGIKLTVVEEKDKSIYAPTDTFKQALDEPYKPKVGDWVTMTKDYVGVFKVGETHQITSRQFPNENFWCLNNTPYAPNSSSFRLATFKEREKILLNKSFLHEAIIKEPFKEYLVKAPILDETTLKIVSTRDCQPKFIMKSKGKTKFSTFVGDNKSVSESIKKVKTNKQITQ
jgi:hypothetical protein